MENVQYALRLIDAVAKNTKNSLGTVAHKLGEEGVAKLIYNAPINRHICMERVVREIIADYLITPGIHYYSAPNIPQILAFVEFEADKNLYGQALYSILTHI